MRWYQRLFPYGVAIAATAIALLLSLWLMAVISRTIGAFFYGAIAVSAWYGGLLPAILAIGLSTLAINHYFLTPMGQFQIATSDDGLRLLLFAVISLLITLLTTNLRDSRRTVERLNRQLMDENADRLRVALSEAQTSKALMQQQFEHQRLITHITHQIRQSLSLPDILQTTVDEVRQFLQADRVIIFRFASNWGGTVTVESVVDGRLAILPFNIHDPCIGETYIKPFQQGLVTAKSDIYAADLSPCHVEFLAQFQVRANLVVPILKNNELWGLLVAHHCTPRSWHNSEIDLLRQIASQLSIALQQSALLEQVQTELNERTQAEAAIQRSEERYRSLVNATVQIVWTTDAMGNMTSISPTWADLTGQPWDETNPWGWVDYVHPDDRDRSVQSWQQAISTQTRYDIEYRLRASNGQYRDFTVRGVPVKNPDQSVREWVGTLTDETERKQAEIIREHANIELERQVAARTAELQRSTDLLGSFFNAASSAAIGLCIHDQNLRFVQVNEALATINGRSIAAHLGKTTTDILPDLAPIVNPLLQQVLTTGQPILNRDIVAAVPSQPGILRYWLASYFPIWNYNSPAETVGVGVIVIEISDRKRAEIALQQQARQEQLRWNITQAIRQSLDLNAILTTAVNAVRQTLQVDRVAVYQFRPGWSGEFIVESAGSNWVKLVEPGVPKVWNDTYLQDTEGGRFQQHETFVVADIYGAGLQPCHIELLEQFQARAYAAAPIFAGSSLWGLLAIYQNTEPWDWQSWEIDLLQQIASQLSIAIQQSELYTQLQIELQERQQATAFIREAERRWRSLLDHVQLIVVGVDQSGHINYVNPFFLTLTGYTQLEVIGKNWFEMFLLPSHQQAMQKVFAEVLTQNAHPYYQDSILTKTGEERLIAWNNTRLQDSYGNFIGTISIGEDITERQRVEKMKNEFISIVSHELRTPLTSIRGSLGLLATGVIDDEPAVMKRMIEVAAIDTERLVRLVNDVLDLEKLESGKVSLTREWCDVATLMQQSIEIMENSAQEAGVRLMVQPLSTQIWVAPDRIIQTFTNLLSNAIKFSPFGGTVTLSAAIDRQEPDNTTTAATHAVAIRNVGTSRLMDALGNTHVRFAVHDQGRGIPTDKLESIFGRFQQVDASDSRDKGGTGLGLAICKSIVHQHEGRIWVESHWGHGSTFFFTLPLLNHETR